MHLMQPTVLGRPARVHALRPPVAGETAVVLLHGALNDHAAWAAVTAGWPADGPACWCPDLPGHGDGADPLQDVPALGAWVAALLDALPCGPVLLAGHSMGSLIALEAAARAAHRVRHLMLLGTAVPMRVSAALLAAAEATPGAAMDLVNQWGWSAAVAADPQMPACAWRTETRQMMERVQAGWPRGNLFLHDFRSCDAYTGGLAAAAELTGPVTLVQAEQDRMTPPRACAELVAQLNPEVCTVPGGHFMLREQAARVRELLLERAAG